LGLLTEQRSEQKRMTESSNRSNSEPKLLVSPNKMVVFLTWETLQEDIEALAGRLFAEMRAMKIALPPEPQSIVDTISQVVEKSHFLKRTPLVTGTPVKPCQHGRTDWTANFFDSGFVPDPETGRVDYWHQTTARSVKCGECLGHQNFARLGVDGIDVFGKVVLAKIPRSYHPRVGRNVRYDDSTHDYYSEIDGRIRLDDDVLSVDEVQTIQGSVGLRSGNVRHLGAVLVHEDVRAGSRIEAQGDIDIMGVVEAASVTTKGDLIIRGGVTSSGGERIEVGGSVHAKYLLDASLVAGRDVVVDVEIVNSTVICFGSVLIPKGRIVGGTVIALRGIQIAQAGSAAAVPTVLIAGDHPDLLLESHKRSEKSIKALEEELKINEDLSAEEISDLKEQIVLVRRQLTNAHEYIKDRSSPRVDVQKMLYQGTTIELGSAKLSVTDDRIGPVKLALEAGEIVEL
jgi:uncharacterized protein (DUF342 family)